MQSFYIEKEEAIEIIISVLAISFAFAIALYRFDSLLAYPKEFFIFVGLCLVTIGSGFIFHEMGHKILAIYYGAYAKFKMWFNGLAFMLITSFFGTLFAAPGAVYIYSQNITKKENGLISLVGPLINVLLMFIFIGLRIFVPVVQYFPGIEGGFLGIGNGKVNVWAFGAGINLMLALFNMIPAFPLDGSKVFAWNKVVWFAVTIFLLGFGTLFFSPFLIISWVIMLTLALVFSKLAFG